jgi:hypothetical protein
MAIMDNDELLEKALYVATESAKLLLGKQGTVLPFALTLDSQGDNIETYFPADTLPGAEPGELVDVAASHLEQCIRSKDVGVIALGTELVAGDQAGLGVQIETRSTSIFLVYPYTGKGRNQQLGKPEAAEGLLVGQLLARDAQ